jgi:hypothetical protein
VARETTKRAGSRKTLSAANLAALGAERLAEILMDAAEDDTALKRRLRMDLAAEVGPDHLAVEIGKRLAALEARRSRVHWRKYKAFVRDLTLLRAMIAGPLAAGDPRLALDLTWRFLGFADPALAQVDDSRGEVLAVFRAAAADLAALVPRARPDAVHLADHLVAALEADEDGVLDDLAPALVQVLDPPGLAAVRARLDTVFHSHARPPAAIRAALQAVLDALGDVDAYVATVPPAEARQPAAGAEIARRLLAAGRAEEALAALARSAPPPGGRALLPGAEAWEDIYLAALEADGQGALAQELRWAAFEKRLASDRLRAFLKRLADFDDVEAQDRALAYAQTFPAFTQALQFLVEWPAPAQAAALVLARAEEIEPGRSELLEAAAHMLEPRHPLAASLLLRAMVADTLRWGRVERAEAAHRQLDALAALAVQIADWGRVEDHAAFVERVGRVRRI